MSDFDTDLLTGVAVLLAAAGHGTWSPSGGYTSGQTGIVLHAFPDTPARVITLTAYGVADDPSLSDSTYGLQVRTRWDGQDPRLVNDLAGAIFSTLQGLTVTLSTGIKVVQCLRRSWVSLGQDDTKRWARSDNYYLDVHRPSTHRQ